MFTVDPTKYTKLLDDKAQSLQSKFALFNPPPLEVFASQATHYRMRAEFRIWHEDSALYYAMFEKGDNKTPVKLTDFPIASQSISDLMAPLLTAISANKNLSRRLYQIDFLTTTQGETLVSLIYHKKLDNNWEALAKELENKFSIYIIGRSRKQKVLLSQDFVTESLSVNNRTYRYQQVENSFTQPNAQVCQHMLDWAQKNSRDGDGDLLELYCGNGNFTIPLANNFSKVLATEVSKSSVRSANYNLRLNSIENVTIVRLSSEEVTQALNGEREFRRLSDINLLEFNFDTVFVDPPRCGLDEKTVQLVSQFNTIIYISCNPDTLLENIESLDTHRIDKFALFDQFPYTDHVECGVILKKK